MSIRDWGTVQKTQRKFLKKYVLLLSNIYGNFEIKLEEYLEKLGENFWKSLRKF